MPQKPYRHPLSHLEAFPRAVSGVCVGRWVPIGTRMLGSYGTRMLGSYETRMLGFYTTRMLGSYETRMLGS